MKPHVRWAILDLVQSGYTGTVERLAWRVNSNVEYTRRLLIDMHKAKQVSIHAWNTDRFTPVPVYGKRKRIEAPKPAPLTAVERFKLEYARDSAARNKQLAAKAAKQAKTLTQGRKAAVADWAATRKQR